jgi:hypothetical protein
MKRWIYTLSLLALIGCTSHAPKTKRLEAKQEERSRELNQSALVANQVNQRYMERLEPDVKPTGTTNYTKAKAASELTGEFLRRNQNNVGLPVEDQTEQVKSLLSENSRLKAKSEVLEAEKEEQEILWRAEHRQHEAALIDMGQQVEKERNKSILRRLYASLGLTGIIAVIAGICIFFPAALPILMRMVAWLVGKIPALAAALGVVSKEAFDQIVRGVENGKAEIKRAREANKVIDPIEALDSNLSKSMDNKHKVLVKARKAKLVQPV